MGGLLIDTLAYNFLKSTAEYDEKSFLYYDDMSRDFFLYLSEQSDQEYYAALGSGQRVKVKKKFQKKAKRAYELALKAIAAAGTDEENEKWNGTGDEDGLIHEIDTALDILRGEG
jgi:hypothetical protein